MFTDPPDTVLLDDLALALEESLLAMIPATTSPAPIVGSPDNAAARPRPVKVLPADETLLPLLLALPGAAVVAPLYATLDPAPGAPALTPLYGIKVLSCGFFPLAISNNAVVNSACTRFLIFTFLFLL